ncbi:nit2p [Saccharomyces arboricola H-6]|uniref:Nit2p n=1 Tax=Saccharomyces arboricola (strain H-6 / AS 2.3317 / CBS 10644) TaxID=1160507 RepID=J8Q3H9_SACAR|nr:nit2p [Saccharomyces arboricola H-6]
MINECKRVAIAQLCSSADMASNLKVVKKMIFKAIQDKADVVFFPEASDYLSQNPLHSRYLAQKSPQFIQELQSSITDLVKQTSRNIDVSIGVHLPPTEQDLLEENDRVKNVLLYINHEGKILQEYQKLHLFDVDVPNGPILKESKSVQPGKVIPDIIDTPVGKLGSAICYDIRFPELSLKLRSMGAEILCFPSAFTTKTGEAHWELLGRARAVDTQCYVIMPGQEGVHDLCDPKWEKQQDVSAPTKSPLRESWGHSMIIGPWGEIIAQVDPNRTGPQLIFANLDQESLQGVRNRMPLCKQRRDDLFH